MRALTRTQTHLQQSQLCSGMPFQGTTGVPVICIRDSHPGIGGRIWGGSVNSQRLYGKLSRCLWAANPNCTGPWLVFSWQAPRISQGCEPVWGNDCRSHPCDASCWVPDPAMIHNSNTSEIQIMVQRTTSGAILTVGTGWAGVCKDSSTMEEVDCGGSGSIWC